MVNFILKDDIKGQLQEKGAENVIITTKVRTC